MWQVALAGRWTARILGALAVLIFLAFVVGEGVPPLTRMTAHEQLYAAGMGCLFLGLGLAWFQEAWGGMLTVFGWALLTALAGKPAWDLPLSIPAALGLLHLVCWWGLRGAAPAPARPGLTTIDIRVVLALLALPLAAFLLLCANEIFGQPPFMSGAAQPDALAGTWRAALTTVSRQALPEEIPVTFTIDANGVVSGAVGNATVTGARLVRNRSWFGRWMHLRTEYLIEGALSRPVESYGGTAGDRFSAPLDPNRGELAGSLFLSHPGAPRALGLILRKQ
jgi:hypothetical protein